MRIIELPASIDSFTHAKVRRSIDIPGESIEVFVLYGTVDGRGDFVPASSRATSTLSIRGDEYTDLVEQVKAIPQRPAEHPDTNFWPSDVDAHLSEDPAVRQLRINARS